VQCAAMLDTPAGGRLLTALPQLSVCVLCVCAAGRRQRPHTTIAGIRVGASLCHAVREGVERRATGEATVGPASSHYLRDLQRFPLERRDGASAQRSVELQVIQSRPYRRFTLP
jgi:hypothetical protein